jgi:hypothetical protein
MNRMFVLPAVASVCLALPGCIVVGQPYAQPYAQPYPTPPFQPQCRQTAGQPGQGPTISCTQPDGSVSTTAAPPAPPPASVAPPSSSADQGYPNQPYPPPPPPGYSGVPNSGY